MSYENRVGKRHEMLVWVFFTLWSAGMIFWGTVLFQRDHLALVESVPTFVIGGMIWSVAVLWVMIIIVDYRGTNFEDNLRSEFKDVDAQ